MFTTAPLFGKFHSPLKDAGLSLRRRPLHHLESLCAQRIDPLLLQPNEAGDNSRERLYPPQTPLPGLSGPDPGSGLLLSQRRRSNPVLLPVHGEFVIERSLSGDPAPLPPNPIPSKLLA